MSRATESGSVPAVRRGKCRACRRENVRLYPFIPYLANYMHWTCARCRPAKSGRCTPDTYTEALGHLLKRREEIDSWIADIRQDGSGNHATGGLA